MADVAASAVAGRAEGLLGSLVRLNLAVTAVLDEIAGSFGLPIADYLVLGVVRGAPEGPTSPSAIADVLGRTTGGMSLTLDRLQSAGWIRRTPDPADGRRVVVELTPRGHDLAVDVNAELHRWERGLDLRDDPIAVASVVDELTETIDAHRSIP
jgi:DNA-binding MarR family transcriptional regulator